MTDKYTPCPNCGKKGFYKISKLSIVFVKGTTHKCKYCDMEFQKATRKGEIAWKGLIPSFASTE
jgi:rubredoxin